jgi:hypothetical protein
VSNGNFKDREWLGTGPRGPGAASGGWGVLRNGANPQKTCPGGERLTGRDRAVRHDAPGQWASLDII